MITVSEEMPPRPKDARDLLTSGGVTTIGDVDRYSILTHDPEDSDRHLFDWQRCLEKCQEMIQEANNMFNSISSPTVCGEVVRSERGTNYLLGNYNNMFNSISSPTVCGEVVRSERGTNYLLGNYNNMFNSISSPTVCGEVVRSERGTNYLLGNYNNMFNSISSPTVCGRWSGQREGPIIY